MTGRAFIFNSYSFDPTTGILSLNYSYESGVSFKEEMRFDLPRGDSSGGAIETDKSSALDASLRLIFLLAGVSYFKAYYPDEIRCEAFQLDAAQEALLRKVYRLGLAEFAFRNGLPLNRDLKIISAGAPSVKPVRLAESSAVLVPVGGGKDSIVTLETLRAGGISPTLFVMSSTSEPPAPIRDTIQRSGLPSILVVRKLSPELIRLNQSGAYNGHIPITAILSAVAVAAGIIHGINTVIMSNESSASEGNLSYEGEVVNHQYSKSLEFERDLSAYLRTHISPGLSYFSLLRPLTELEIARRFSRYRDYHRAFRSCNAAFKQTASDRLIYWCGQCPKCRFVFLALAPFMERGELVGIFGRDLLNDAAAIDGFAELCGLSEHKPFECVGEIRESRIALKMLARSSVWRGDVVVANLAPRIVDEDDDLETEVKTILSNRDEHCVPGQYLRMLDASR